MRSVCRHWRDSVLGWFILRKSVLLETRRMKWRGVEEIGQLAVRFLRRAETSEYEKNLLFDRLLLMLHHEDYLVRFHAVEVLDVLKEMAVDMAPRLMNVARTHWPTEPTYHHGSLETVLHPANSFQQRRSNNNLNNNVNNVDNDNSNAAPATPVIPPSKVDVRTWKRKALVFALSSLTAGQQRAGDAAGAGATMDMIFRALGRVVRQSIYPSIHLATAFHSLLSHHSAVILTYLSHCMHTYHQLGDHVQYLSLYALPARRAKQREKK